LNFKLAAACFERASGNLMDWECKGPMS